MVVLKDMVVLEVVDDLMDEVAVVVGVMDDVLDLFDRTFPSSRGDRVQCTCAETCFPWVDMLKVYPAMPHYIVAFKNPRDQLGVRNVLLQ